MARALSPWVAPALVLVAWELLSRAGVIPARLLPAPLDVLAAGVEATRRHELLTHLGVSALRAAAGLAIGTTIGLTLGVMTGLSRSLQLVFDGPLQMVRAIPVLSMVPLVILWFGLGETAKIFIVAFSTVFPVYLNTFHGVRSVDPHLIEMARVYGLRGIAFYREVILPGALPSILVGFRFALGIAWIVMIVAESTGAITGLGYVANNAREFMQMDVLVLTILLWALLGKLSDVLARQLERRLLPWLPKAQRMEAT